ncbi:transcriptional regulator [Synechococcus sp. PCC 7502]|uniref:LysR family transcriptional regulator n=1 Tax=Synechococcus sp. PCC 7502 TaxID=1173263 RepID=UPI00029F96CA|nr:LysR family transcriptional regulator [Synechococcus sp. PCC 7502]AFY73748.1 transcriptional regulator [Synechococcus sp. PCC 7502]
MRLEQLQAFIAVAETGSFQKAAQKCNITQSTVSRQVQSLEQDLGVQLLHRHSQAKLTIAGERFVGRARKICNEWDTATQELADLIAGNQPELCVAAIPSVCAYQMSPVLQKFRFAYPDVQLRVTALGSDRALKVLKDGLIDIAVVMNNRFIAASPEIVVDSLYTETIMVLMAADHPLTKYRAIPWQELGTYPHVVFKDGYATQRLVQDQFRLQQIKVDAALELNSLDAFRDIIRQSNLIALLTQSSLSGVEKDLSLAVRNTESPILTTEVVCVTTSDRLQIPPIRYFRQLVCELITTDQSDQALTQTDLSLFNSPKYSQIYRSKK